MKKADRQLSFKRILSDYGMLPVLLLLCVLFSVLTIKEQTVTGQVGAERLFESLSDNAPTTPNALIVTAQSNDEIEFAKSLTEKLRAANWNVTQISGDPATVRLALEQLDSTTAAYSIFSTSAFHPVVQQIASQSSTVVFTNISSPPSRRWPTFLLTENLRNVANQITVIAIIAIGMTMVIITAGIDLSVGSLIALSAVVIAYVIGPLGGADVSMFGIIIASLAALAACTAVGAFSGLMITTFRIPPFIATLAMMQVAAGLAYIISQGRPIYQLPANFVWLGRGTDPLLKLPIAVILMLLLYFVAWVVMERSVLGRHIYAVGGNPEAARLSGVKVNSILMFAYTLCGLLAGIGGIIMASQLKSGAPTYGLTYELYVIAAVVVGGTSLSGGEGKIIGTLIGAFIIGVIQNGMNLTNIETYTQKVVLGLVILAAVLFDRMKQKGFKRSFGFLKPLP
jgi:ribose transport system permease protein